MTAAHPPVRILMVCTGNICRSPYAEYILQDGFDRLAPGEFEVGSVGTMGLRQKPIQPPMDEFLAAKGIDASDFESRRMSAPIFKAADLILALTTEHRDEILALSPGSLQKTFTLTEFAALLENLTEAELEKISALSVSERWAWLIRHAVISRPSVAKTLQNYDIEDPYMRDRKVFEAVAGSIERAAAVILGVERAAQLPGDAR